MHDFLKTKYYFINKFDSNNIDRQDRSTIIIYRNYTENKINEDLVLKIKNYCKKKRKNFYLSNNVKLAIKLDLDGVYIPSFNKNLAHLNFSLKKKFNLVGSAHNLKEIRTKELQQVNKIFISSLFKKNKNYLGINRFKLIYKLTSKQVVALGGISKKNKRLLLLLNDLNFEGISYFA
jgi:thiamine-phosphate pyrophosphorylase